MVKSLLESELEASGITAKEFQNLPIEPWQKWVGGILASILSLAIGLPAAYELLIRKIGNVPVYLGLALGIGISATGVAIWWIRDKKAFKIIVIGQIALAVAAGLLAFFSTTDAMAQWITYGAASVTVANGVEKLMR